MGAMITSRYEQDRSARAAVARRAYLAEHKVPTLPRTPCPDHGAEPCAPGRRACRPAERYCEQRRAAHTEACAARRQAARDAGRDAAEAFDAEHAPHGPPPRVDRADPGHADDEAAVPEPGGRCAGSGAAALAEPVQPVDWPSVRAAEARRRAAPAPSGGHWPSLFGRPAPSPSNRGRPW